MACRLIQQRLGWQRKTFIADLYLATIEVPCSELAGEFDSNAKAGAKWQACYLHDIRPCISTKAIQVELHNRIF